MPPSRGGGRGGFSGSETRVVPPKSRRSFSTLLIRKIPSSAVKTRYCAKSLVVRVVYYPNTTRDDAAGKLGRRTGRQKKKTTPTRKKGSLEIYVQVSMLLFPPVFYSLYRYCYTPIRASCCYFRSVRVGSALKRDIFVLFLLCFFF